MKRPSQGTLPDLQLERMTTAEQAAAVVRTAILGGRLLPRTQLTEVQLAADLGVSRNTLREALRLLEYQGLVTRVPHRGVVVTALDAEDVRDIYAVRKILEPAAVAALLKAQPNVIDRLDELVGKMRDAAEDEDWPQLVELDVMFHETIVQQLKSRRLAAFFRTVCLELRIAMMLVDRSSGVAEWLEEHGRLLSAFRSGDEELARQAVEAHLSQAESALAESVQ